MIRLILSVLLVVSIFAMAAAADAADSKQVEVTATSTTVMSGSDIVGTVKQGQKFTVLSEQPTWFQIEIEAGGQKRKGWIRQADVKSIETAATTVAVESAPSVTPPKNTKKWLRATSEGTEVKSGANTIAKLSRNRVLPIASIDGRWHQIKDFEPGESRVGYVLDTGIELLDERMMGTSLDDFTPFAIASATTTVDWAKDEVSISAALPVVESSTTRLLAADGRTPAPETYRVQVAAGAVTVRLTGSSWSQLARSETRSLWLAEGNVDRPRMHRIDLPAVELGTAVTAARIKDFDEGLLLSLPVSGLLPGYLVEHAYRTADGRTSPVQVLERTKGSSPRVADVIAGSGTWPYSLRVVVPFAAEQTEAITHLFLIRHQDGSLTRTISVSRRGDTVTAAAKELAPAVSLPVDVVAIVPSVELLPASEAAAAVSSAGLQPLFVDQATFNRRTLDEVRDSVVLRQGRSAGDHLLVGSPLLMGVRDDQGLALIDSSSLGLVEGEPTAPGKPATGPGDDPAPNKPPMDQTAENPDFVTGGLEGDEPATNSAIIDTGEELQFVDVNQSGLIGGSDGLQGTLGNEPLPDGGVISDGLLTDSSSGSDTTVPSDGDLQPDLLVPVNPDPGVHLDPTVNGDAVLLTGILKIVIDAILNQPDPAKLPGPIGQAITAAISQFEKPLTTPANPAAEAQAVSAIFNVVLDKLQIGLTDSIREKALADWARQRQRDFRKPLDRNGNFVAADDVVLFFVVWLHRQGHYNPAANVVISQDGLGNAVATMSNTPVSLDWLKKLPPLGKPGAPPSIPSSGTGPKPKPQPVDPLAQVPQGKPVVSLGSGPNLVKVPQMNEKLLSTVRPRLDDLGLDIRNVADLFSTDRVVNSDLKQGEWVKADSKVALKVVRAVPNLVKQSLVAANAELKQHRLSSATDGKTFNSDIVVEQQPSAGEYISPDTPVKLGLAIVVPNVTGMLFPKARETLTARDLKLTYNTQAFQVDTVASQSPPSGAIAAHGDGIEVTLHLPVPSVAGLTLEKARSVAKDWDLALVVENRFARDTDIVRGQSPAPKSLVPHQSDFRLGPVVTRVPDVRGISVEQAEANLKAGDFDFKRIGDLVAADKVTMQDPIPGTEYERGRAITLDARVKLPGYGGAGLVDARDAILKLGGNLKVKVDGPVGRADLVYAQQPNGDTLVYPRTEVVLVPGVNVTDMSGLTTPQANAELQRIGLKGTIRLGPPIETTDQNLVGQRLVGGQNPNPGLYRRADLGVVQLEANVYELAMRTVPNVGDGQVGAAVDEVQQAELTPVIVFRGQSYSPRKWAAFVVLEQLRIAAAGNEQQLNLKVVNQAPEAGSQVPIGSQVQIYVSDGLMFK